MAVADRVNPNDPSGMRKTEDRRADRSLEDFDKMLDRILRRVEPGTAPAELQRIVEDETRAYGDDTRAAVLKWVQDTQKRSVLRSSQLLKAVGVPAGAILGPAGLPQDLRDRIEIQALASIDSLEADAKKKITRELLAGIEAGEGADDLRKRLVDNTGLERNRAQVIARTETMNAFRDTSRAAYQQVGVKRGMWYAAMDDRTCDECMSHHLKVYDLDKWPHVHGGTDAQCRCTALPVAEKEA